MRNEFDSKYFLKPNKVSQEEVAKECKNRFPEFQTQKNTRLLHTRPLLPEQALGLRRPRDLCAAELFRDLGRLQASEKKRKCKISRRKVVKLLQKYVGSFEQVCVFQKVAK